MTSTCRPKMVARSWREVEVSRDSNRRALSASVEALVS